MSKTSAIVALALLLAAPALGASYQYTGLWAKPGLSMQASTPQGVELTLSLDKLGLEDVVINREAMQSAVISALTLPNQAGAPDVPSLSRFVAVPQGARARVEVVSKETEVIRGVNLTPAPAIPNEHEDGLTYFKDQAIYSANAAYPDWIAKVSEPTSLRGVDAVLVAVSPLQYNPATKELFVHRNIRVRVTFEGGNGRFGEDRLRSRWWDPVLAGNLINFDQLPKIDYDARAGSRDGYEYVIICPNDATCLAWADTIKQFRKQQGISTEVYNTDVTGTTASAIETWINNAYNTWGTPPVAILLIGDRPGQGTYTVDARTAGPHPYSGTYYPCDNIYADVTGNDSLPEINVARLTANTPARLATMVNKFLSYERQPYTTAGFYDNPLVACGWQTDRWFQLCTEVVRGFFDSAQGKSCAHAYKVYSGTPTVGGAWSTATNTSTVVNYFNNLGYIPLTNPYNSTYWNAGTAGDINNAINAGAFIVQHRDHGWEDGWGEPAYNQGNALSLVNTMYPFVFTINCLTGAYQQTSGSYPRDSICLGEAFHRQEHGALGFIGPSETSYSFVNDAFIFGLYDCMWPQFDPGYDNGTHLFGNYNLMPGFAQAYGKYYLQASSWPYNPSSKVITYNLFHMHGDAFTTLYSEMPQDLTVIHDGVLMGGVTSFAVSADEGAFIALTVDGEIIGTGTAPAKGTVNITIPSQTPGSVMIVTATKANYRRYSAEVPVIAASGPFVVHLNHYIDDAAGIPDGQLNPGESAYVPVWLKNMGSDPTNGSAICTLKTSSPYATVTGAVLDYGVIAADDSALALPGFAVDVDPGCPHGQSITFQLVAHDGDTAWTSQFSATVYVSQMAPTPDNAAGSPIYYAVEDIDAADRAPTYQWTEIRDVGTQMTVLNGNNQTARVALPFPFAWYGTTYAESLSVCTNGWVSLGRTTNTAYANTALPATNPNVPGIFPMWDDLTASTTGSWIGYWHDAANHRFYVEFDSLTFNGQSDRLKFQVVFEESTAASPYYDVVLYYNIFADPSSDITVGFQQNSTVGCQAQFDTSRALTFSALGNGRAVRITRHPDPMGVAGGPQAAALPRSFKLERAYPNPMRQGTTISYQLPKDTRASLKVFNVLGQQVRVLDEGQRQAGVHNVRWDGRDADGRMVSAGVYLFRLETPGYTGTGRMTVVR